MAKNCFQNEIFQPKNGWIPPWENLKTLLMPKMEKIGQEKEKSKKFKLKKVRSKKK